MGLPTRLSQLELTRRFDHRCKIFHLIGRNEVGMRADGRLPARHHFLFAPKVVVLVPAVVFGLGISIQAVELDEIAQTMAVTHKLFNRASASGVQSPAPVSPPFSTKAQLVPNQRW